MIDASDRKIINSLQGGFPVCDEPFAEAAKALDLGEDELLTRIANLRESGVLSRFGPMYNAEAMGGAFCLCAVAVPEARMEAVVEQINAHAEVAHNYERAHELNIWFVLGSDDPARIDAVIGEIESETGLDVYAFPKEHEFFIGLKVDA
ncbi:MAG: Lrp/AsnC family transcriptional regulator [Hyphomicrobiaceae bacterium]|nr:Lrp/AsnC family transcriptional regulator [Hyphomicrobiaceae bacterium]